LVILQPFQALTSLPFFKDFTLLFNQLQLVFSLKDNTKVEKSQEYVHDYLYHHALHCGSVPGVNSLEDESARLSMEQHKRVSINAPPQSDALFCSKVGLK